MARIFTLEVCRLRKIEHNYDVKIMMIRKIAYIQYDNSFHLLAMVMFLAQWIVLNSFYTVFLAAHTYDKVYLIIRHRLKLAAICNTHIKSYKHILEYKLCG